MCAAHTGADFTTAVQYVAARTPDASKDPPGVTNTRTFLFFDCENVNQSDPEGAAALILGEETHLIEKPCITTTPAY